MSSPDPRKPPISRLASVALEATDPGPADTLAFLVTLLVDGAEPVTAAHCRTPGAARASRRCHAVRAATVPRLLAAFLLYYCLVCERNTCFETDR